MAKPKEKEVEKKKRQAVISDSDSEGEVAVPAKKVTKASPKPKKETKTKAEPAKPKLKEINATDFFSSNTSSSKTSVTPSKKRKEVEQEEKDKAFTKTLEETDFPVQMPKKQKTECEESKPSLASKLANQVSESTSKTESKESTTKTQTKESTTKVQTKESTTKTQTKPKSPSPINPATPVIQSPGVLDDSVSEIPGTPQEQHEERKAVKQAAYKKFLSRSVLSPNFLTIHHPGAAPGTPAARQSPRAALAACRAWCS